MGGSKILSMVVENFHFLDSLNYLPMSLKSLSKSFDLICKKGTTPTSSIRPEILIILSPNFTGQALYLDERARFMQWHQEQKGKLFSNKDELLAYCMDDVNVLTQACCAFRNLFLKLVKMDPFIYKL